VRRREFITLLAGAAVTWPLAARAQQPAMPVIGYLSSASSDLFADRVRAFRRGLNETGFVEGRNVAMEYRWAEGQNDRLPALATDLVRHQVTVIAAISDSSALAAKAATATIPIVFTGGSDPVKLGLVGSLNRPGGNLTGVSNLNAALGPKRLELLYEIVPNAAVIGLLVNPTGANAGSVTREVREAARSLGPRIEVVRASTEHDIDMVFASLLQLRARALLIGADAFFNTRSEQLAALTVRHAVPAIFQTRDFAAAGGLMSYTTNLADVYRQAGIYVGRILKGEKPTDLAVQQSTKVELIINLKTAKALGLTIPLPLLGRADEVIE
jgi:putative ABC transport system substrate-binding protein